MGTKANPGKYDCYDKAGPDEPLFVLRANDPMAPMVVKFWIYLSQEKYKNSEGWSEKLVEAEKCVNDMVAWKSRKNWENFGVD